MAKAILTKDMIEAFIMHPDWPRMQAYIEAHFEASTSIQEINVDNPSTTVHAEVIATQKIERDLQGLSDAFSNARQTYGKVRKGYE